VNHSWTGFQLKWSAAPLALSFSLERSAGDRSSPQPVCLAWITATGNRSRTDTYLVWI